DDIELITLLNCSFSVSPLCVITKPSKCLHQCEQLVARGSDDYIEIVGGSGYSVDGAGYRTCNHVRNMIQIQRGTNATEKLLNLHELYSADRCTAPAPLISAPNRNRDGAFGCQLAPARELHS